MDPATARRLADLNREFYQTFAGEFSGTRQRLQPGVRKILSGLGGSEQILDLGCGNGQVARSLTRVGFNGSYLGLDYAPALLKIAGAGLDSSRYRFAPADLTLPGRWMAVIPGGASFDRVFCFATMHHIPSTQWRLEVLRGARTLIRPGGQFILSVWQFLNSDKMRARLQPWASAGLTDSAVDEQDYLLDWRGSGPQHGLRYVHHLSESELAALAERSDFEILETF